MVIMFFKIILYSFIVSNKAAFSRFVIDLFKTNSKAQAITIEEIDIVSIQYLIAQTAVTGFP